MYKCKYNCFDIAKQFLTLAGKEGTNIDPMKLLKLVYISHGYYLGFFNKPLFDNRIEAWKHGPVIPDLYHTIKIFGNNAVDERIINLHVGNDDIKKEDKDFLKNLWDAYKKYDGLELSTKTHEKGSPWYKYRDQYESKPQIPDPEIKGYYKHIIDEWEKQQEKSV